MKSIVSIITISYKVVQHFPHRLRWCVEDDAATKGEYQGYKQPATKVYIDGFWFAP